MEYLRRTVTDSTDLEAVLRIAGIAGSLQVIEHGYHEDPESIKKVRIGVIRDKVFSFYYPENLEALNRAGADLVYIDSLRDESLPAIDGLYIGGGFPEIFGTELEQNTAMRTSIRKAVVTGLPVYAECGGLMYLARKLHYEGAQF